MKNIIRTLLLRPGTYVFLGIIAAGLFAYFNTTLSWIALLITLLALPVHFGNRWYIHFRRLGWESLWLEEDYVE